jgi:hypothetical protein
MPSPGMRLRLALLRTDVSKDRIASIIRVTRIGDLGSTLEVTNNRSTLRHDVTSQRVIAVKASNLTHSINRLDCVAET